MGVRVASADPPVFKEFEGQKGFKHVKVWDDPDLGEDDEGYAEQFSAADMGFASIDYVNDNGSGVKWDAETSKFDGVGEEPVTLLVYGRYL